MSVVTEPPATDLPSQKQGGDGLARRVARGGALYIAARLLTQVILWPITFVVARILDPSDYGLMTSGIIFVGLSDLLAEAGMSKFLIQKKELQPRDVAEAFTVNVVLSAIMYGLLFLLATPLASFFHEPKFESFLRILALTILLVPFRAIPWALLAREHSLGSQSVVTVISSFLQAASVLGLALAGMGYWSLVVGAAAARSIEAVTLSWYAGWRPRLCIPNASTVPLLIFGVHITLYNLLSYLYHSVDVVVIGKMLDQTELGYYSLAFQLMSLPVQKLTDNVNSVIYPVYCRLQSDRPRLRDWYLRLTMMLSVVGMPVLTGMALVANEAFVLLLGEKWIPAIRPFQLLCMVGAIMVVKTSLPPLITALGRPDLNVKGVSLEVISAVCAESGPAPTALRWDAANAAMLP